MSQKRLIVGIGVVILGIMIIDKYSTLFGATICGILAYWGISTFLKSWLEGVLQNVGHGVHRLTRHHQRKKVLKLNFILPSGNLLPWIEKILILRTKLYKKPYTKPSSCNLEDDYDQEDVSPSSEQSTTFSILDTGMPNMKFCGNTPSQTSEIKSFVYHISDSYVKTWYKKVSSNEDFLHDIDYILEDVLVNICGRISKLNLNQLMNQIYILAHNHILVCHDSTNEDHKAPMKHSKFERHQNGQFHPAVQNSKSEIIYLSIICETVLDLVGPQDMLVCPLLRTILTELLTHNLLHPLSNLLTNPAFLFWTIVYFVGDSSLLGSISKMDDKNSVISCDQSARAKRRIDLHLPLKDDKKQKVHSSIKETATRRSRLARTKSFSYNSLLDLDQLSPSSLDDSSQDKHDSSQYKIQESNLSDVNHLSESSWDLWKSMPLDGYIVSRPPFSLFPVPGHSCKTGRSSRKSSPNRVFTCLPKKKLRTTAGSIHISQSLDELILPPTTVFQNTGSRVNFEHMGNQANTSSFEVEQAEEATEAADMQHFFNVLIPNTEKMLDTRMNKYILYCIQYSYLEQETGASVAKEEDEPILIPCTAVVRRRFREFLALQNRLENCKLKKYLKGIKGPSKWLSSSFSPSDKRNVEKRRLFLQGYLQKLCAKEALATSSELQEFFAYKGDAHIAFVKKALDLAVPRIDKMVVRGFMGAIDLLKTALPNMPQESPNNGEDPKSALPFDKHHAPTRSILTGFTRCKSNTRLPLLEFSCKVERVSPLSQDIYNFLDSFDTSSSPEDSRPNSPTIFTSYPIEGPSRGLLSTNMPAWKKAISRLDNIQPPPPTGPRFRGDGCDSLDLNRDEMDQRVAHLEKIKENFQAEAPLADALIDSLLCVLFPAHSLSDDYAVLTLKILLSDLLQKWLQKHMKRFSNKEHCIHYLHNLHDILWPNNSQTSQKIGDMDTCREAALQALLSLFPGNFKHLLGIPDVNYSISVFLNCIQNQMTNRSLLYHIVDVVMDMVCAQDLQQSIL